ncbi:MAG: YraN family protein [Acidobacteria bacterium]|nr:YraN family protein [Acidobacteriota bacterium]MCB9377673.1 YraN family protein [Holophagales bacterium]
MRSGRLGEFDRLPHDRARGRAAEDAAEAYLREQGLRVVARNVTTRAGELDLVALDGETLCFVEIKARSSAEFGRSIEAVGPRKQERIARAAALFLARNRSQRACRFDVLGLDRAADGTWTFTYLRDAFRLG